MPELLAAIRPGHTVICPPDLAQQLRPEVEQRGGDILTSHYAPAGRVLLIDGSTGGKRLAVHASWGSAP